MEEDISSTQVGAFLKYITILPAMIDGPSKKLTYRKVVCITIPEKGAIINKAGYNVLCSNTVDRLANIGDSGEDYDISQADFKSDRVEWTVTLHPFNNRTGHLYVELSAYVEYEYPEEYKEEK